MASAVEARWLVEVIRAAAAVGRIMAEAAAVAALTLTSTIAVAV